MPGGNKRSNLLKQCTWSMFDFLLQPSIKGLRSIWKNQPKINKRNKETNKNSANQ